MTPNMRNWGTEIVKTLEPFRFFLRASRAEAVGQILCN